MQPIRLPENMRSGTYGPILYSTHSNESNKFLEFKKSIQNKTSFL